MSNIIGIDPAYDYLFDPQQAAPAGWCPLCRAEIYGDAELCLRCQEDAEDGD